ncbi:hypothetical protein MTR67_002715 [Solanum verrucosum]|uniref:Uncharacterized protein n=1 Tax=Solanum verrucosum TaxID=315347 RepID=A0AAF0PU74_SOLVR|nr:hypothetical protein MTR67_002715 [Solanum verrucosum]
MRLELVGLTTMMHTLRLCMMRKCIFWQIKGEVFVRTIQGRVGTKVGIESMMKVGETMIGNGVIVVVSKRSRMVKRIAS